MKRKPAEWLDTALVIGPFLRLCLSQQDYDEATSKLEMCQPGPFVSKGRGATLSWGKNHAGKWVAVVGMDPENAQRYDGIQICCLLLHEAVHVFQGHCRHIGEDEPSDEFEAYSVQAIAQALMYSFGEQMRLVK